MTIDPGSPDHPPPALNRGGRTAVGGAGRYGMVTCSSVRLTDAVPVRTSAVNVADLPVGYPVPRRRVSLEDPLQVLTGTGTTAWWPQTITQAEHRAAPSRRPARIGRPGATAPLASPAPSNSPPSPVLVDLNRDRLLVARLANP